MGKAVPMIGSRSQVSSFLLLDSMIIESASETQGSVPSGQLCEDTFLCRGLT